MESVSIPGAAERGVMSNHCYPATRPKAAKEHRCIACFEDIQRGEVHIHQAGFWKGRAFRNRFHVECWDYLIESGDLEFTPGEFDPPERLQVQQHGAGKEGS